jgi:peptidoglycan hydrolase-like protein with peptidoglycan-binding domain
MRQHGIGLAFAAATLITGIALSPTASAGGSVWDSVAACESGGNWAINTGNGFYGGLQFTASTWAAYGGTRYAASANRASKAAQIVIAQRVLAGQGPGAWPVCGRRAGLTRASGAARPPTVSRSLTRVSVAARVRLTVDGRIGPKTIGAIQRWVGVAANGSFGSTTVRALQAKVGASPDGVVGPHTVQALQVKIGARRDGARYLDSATVAALQRYLNTH